MASCTSISKYESLNAFIHERLTNTAGEIFQAVKDVLTEFQEEIYRSKQENIYLKKRLGDISTSESDTQTKQEEFSLENENLCPLDSDTPEIQVKLELSNLHQDPGTPQQFLAHAAVTCEPPPGVSNEVVSGKENGDVSVYMDSYVTVKVEPSDSQVTYSDNLSVVENGSSGAHMQEEPGLHPSSQHVQSTYDLRHPPSHDSLTEVLFPCEVCNKSFKKRPLLKKHMLTHQKDTAHRCEFCGKCYSQSRALQYHIRTHTGERPYQRKSHMMVRNKSSAFRCDLCGKWYSTSYALKLHLRTHTGERPYSCKFCVKTFSQTAHVKEHERIHTGEKPYSCSLCGKRFNRAYQVKAHIRNYHPDDVATIIRSRQHM